MTVVSVLLGADCDSRRGFEPHHRQVNVHIYIYVGIKSSTVQKTSSTKRFRLSPSSEFIQVKNQSFNICTYKAHESRKNKKIMDIVSK